MSNHIAQDCPFCGILRGEEPGTIIAQDSTKGFAIIQSIHPESVVHWLAVPFEHMESTEEFEHTNEKRFVELFEWAIATTKKKVVERALPGERLYPQNPLWLLRDDPTSEDPHPGNGVKEVPEEKE